MLCIHSAAETLENAVFSKRLWSIAKEISPRCSLSPCHLHVNSGVPSPHTDCCLPVPPAVLSDSDWCFVCLFFCKSRTRLVKLCGAVCLSALNTSHLSVRVKERQERRRKIIKVKPRIPEINRKKQVDPESNQQKINK